MREFHSLNFSLNLNKAIIHVIQRECSRVQTMQQDQRTLSRVRRKAAFRHHQPSGTLLWLCARKSVSSDSHYYYSTFGLRLVFIEQKKEVKAVACHKLFGKPSELSLLTRGENDNNVNTLLSFNLLLFKDAHFNRKLQEAIEFQRVFLPLDVRSFRNIRRALCYIQVSCL